MFILTVQVIFWERSSHKIQIWHKFSIKSTQNTNPKCQVYSLHVIINIIQDSSQELFILYFSFIHFIPNLVILLPMGSRHIFITDNFVFFVYHEKLLNRLNFPLWYYIHRKKKMFAACAGNLFHYFHPFLFPRAMAYAQSKNSNVFFFFVKK